MSGEGGKNRKVFDEEGEEEEDEEEEDEGELQSDVETIRHDTTVNGEKVAEATPAPVQVLPQNVSATKQIKSHDYLVRPQSNVSGTLGRGMVVIVRTLRGRTVPYRIWPNDSLYSLKLKVQLKEKVPPTHQFYVYASKCLDDDEMPLSAYGIKDSSVISVAFRIEPAPITSLLIPPRSVDHSHRYVIVLDLDETLINGRDFFSILLRPGCIEFMKTLQRLNCEVVVWTAGVHAYAQRALNQMDALGIVQHCIARNASWWTGETGYRKDLSRLGRPMDQVLFVDNTPTCMRGHEANSILVSDFTSPTQYDNTLSRLGHFVESLCNSELSVPQMLSSSDMTTQRTVRTHVGDQLTLYTLASSNPCISIASNRLLPEVKEAHEP
eukprot:PhF_6_TR15469/c0_g2_i3/m.24057/K15731/CTDSP; carboxy-terminal domain RNA polymerase II polypeptide A small phosphatase